MEPTDNPDNNTCNCEHSTEYYNVYTYEITYVGIDGITKTQLIDATTVITDGELVELWDGDDLIFAVSDASVQQIRNVSRLDMPLP